MASFFTMNDNTNIDNIIDELRNDNVESANRLTEIKLHGAKLGGEQLKELSNALRHQTVVKSLDLRYCFIEGGVRSLIHFDSLEKVAFSFCGVDNDDAQALAELLSNESCNLKELHLGSGCIMTTTGIHCLATALAVNKSLVELNMSGSGIGDYGALVFSMALQQNGTLQRLILQRTLISNVGVEQLASVLKCDNTTLIHLDLSHTLVREQGVKAMAECLKRKNTTLHRVVLTARNNNKYEAQVRLYTSQNRAGRGLLVNPDTPVSLAPTLLERANNDAQTLYGLLREVPHLCASGG